MFKRLRQRLHSLTKRSHLLLVEPMRTPKRLKIAETRSRLIAVDWESLGYNITRCHTFNVTICYHYMTANNRSKADCLDMDPKGKTIPRLPCEEWTICNAWTVFQVQIMRVKIESCTGGTQGWAILMLKLKLFFFLFLRCPQRHATWLGTCRPTPTSASR